jgi:O-antigen ligase
LFAGTIVTWKECRWVFTCAAVSFLIPIVFSLYYGGASDRLNLDFKGSIANPNYLAAHLLLLLAFCLFFVLRPKSPFVFRILACGVGALGLYAILRTGSRGAMIALGVGMLLLIWRSTTRQRVIMTFLAPLAIAGTLFLIPTSTLNRLTSFSPDEDSRLEAIQSSESRQYLLRKSIDFSLQHPIFGVGMGQFSLVEGMTSREAGERGNWHETHNAFTQVSSETGMPALVFFVGSIAAMLLLFNKVVKRAKAVGHAEMMVAANCAFIGAVAFCVAIFFLSLAYVFYLPALTGLAIAMNACADRELSQFAARRSTVPAPAPRR